MAHRRKLSARTVSQTEFLGMKQSWFEYNFGWIRNDIKHLIQQLKQPETWVVLGMLAAFSLIAFFVIRLALRSDTLLRALHPGSVICRELGEKSIAYVFISGFIFVLCAMASLGEFINFIECKRQKLKFEEKQALKGTAGWGLVAVMIGLSSLTLLDYYCA